MAENEYFFVFSKGKQVFYLINMLISYKIRGIMYSAGGRLSGRHFFRDFIFLEAMTVLPAVL